MKIPLLLCLGVLLGSALSSSAWAQIAVQSLRVENSARPLGIDAQPPRLSWDLTSPKNDEVQSAYQVLVASSAEKLKADQGDLWDSGKVASDQSIYVPFAGKPLGSGQECHWKVKVWDGKGRESAWSEPGFWSMGLLKPEDWKGKWIGYNQEPQRRLPKEGVRSKMTWDDTNWIWTGEADATTDAPAGKRFFKFNFDLLPGKQVKEAYLRVTADDQYRIFFGGQGVERTNGDDWKKPVEVELVPHDIRDGKVNAAIEVTNTKKGSAGVACKIAIEYTDGTMQVVSADEKNSTWTEKVTEEQRKDWMRVEPKELKMNPVKVTGPVGIEPWGKPEAGVIPGFEQTAPSPLLRKDFTLGQPVKRATLYSVPLGCGEIFLNGKRVGDEVLNPTHTQYHQTVLYTTHDVTDLLQKGKNALGVMLGNGWYNMTTRTIWLIEKAPWRDNPKLLATLRIEFEDGTTEDIVTDTSWKATAGPVIADSIHNGEYYDARDEKKGWTEADYDDSKWASADVVPATKGTLHAQMIAPMKIEETIKAERILEPSPGVYVVDFGKNVAGHVRMKVEGPAGQEVRLIYGEKIMDDLTVDRHLNGLTWGGSFQEDAYVLRGEGVEEWEPRFTYHGFRYVEVHGYPGKPTLDSFESRFVHTAFPGAGEFSSSNSLLNAVQDASRRTYKGNFHGFPEDCPTREKKGWLGDAHLAVEAAMWNFDNTAGYLNWFRDIRGNQNAEGKLKQIAPTGGWGVDDPDWTAAIIVMPWTIYLYSADQTILSENYDMMKRWMASKEKEFPDHIITYGCGDWVVPFKRSSHVVTSTCYYHSIALKLAQIADVLGHPEDAKYYRELADKIREAFNQAFVKADGSIDNRAIPEYTKGPGGAGADQFTQTAQAMALFHGLISPEQQPAVLGKLVEIIGDANDTQDVGYLGAKALWRTLSDQGRHDLAYKLATNTSMPSYGFWVSQGFNTLNEMWQGTKKGGGGGSNNHPAFSDISAWYFQYLAGINPVWSAPGFKESVIKPMPVAALGAVSASHDSPYGRIASHWQLKGSPKGTVFALETEIPVNTSSTIHIPSADGEVKVNGKPLDKIPGLTVVSKKPGEVVVKVGSGDYRFETLWTEPKT